MLINAPLTPAGAEQAAPGSPSSEAAASPSPEGTPAAPEATAAEAAQGPAVAATTATPALFPIAVMVDNYRLARPQSGLGAAEIVYEALAEGGITRFLAIYTADDPGMVGPVRSARHYYVFWAAEYNAPLVHIMASDEGYAALVDTGLPDLDEHRGDPGFVRADSRPAPYNAFTFPAEAREILRDNGGLWPGSLGGFDHRGKVRGGAPATSLDLAYPGDHSVRWTYDQESGVYLREQDGYPQVDAATGQQLAASTVVVQMTPAWPMEEVAGEVYMDMGLEGKGRAVVFAGGRAIEATWNRPTIGVPTAYTGRDGKPVIFPPGPIWVPVLPTGEVEGQLSYEASSDSIAASGR